MAYCLNDNNYPDLSCEITALGVQVSPWLVASMFVLTIVVIFFLKRILLWGFRRTNYWERMGTHGHLLIEKSIGYITLGVGIVLLFQLFGVQFTALVAVLGLAGFGLAFGLQSTLNNIFAGVALIIDDAFKVGDTIKVGDTFGEVVDISLRSTKVHTVNNEVVTIPNGLLAKEEVWNLTNKGDKSLWLNINTVVDYDADWKRAAQLMLGVAQAHPDRAQTEEPVWRMAAHGDNGIEMYVRLKINDAADRWKVESDVLATLKDQFDANNIVIPYPQRVVRNR